MPIQADANPRAYCRCAFPAVLNQCLWMAACLTLAILLAITTPAAQAELPDALPELGDASSSIISPQLERKIGRDFLKQINAGLPTIEDPLLKHYTLRHMTKLAQHSELDDKLLSVALIDSDQINAFAAPGGVIGINLGLMLAAEDVHEYSAVLAHELAHLSQRHFARGIEEQRSQALPNLAGLLAAVMIGALGGGEAGIAAISTAQAAAQANQLRYSRGREQEADRIGLNTLVNADMDPNAMGRMFERMQRQYRFSRRPPEFLLTHPLTESRIADARGQAQRYPSIAYDDSEEFHLMRVRAQVYYAQSPQNIAKQFRRTLRSEPNNRVAQYGLALALAEAGEATEALVIADQLFGNQPDLLLSVAAYADLLIKSEKIDQALRLLSHQLVLNPDNRPLAMLYADGLAKAEEYDQAQAVLARQSVVNANDADVWYNLAEVAGQAGDILAVHQARAEYFVLHGSYQRAIQHLEYARRLVRGKANQPELARLEQRIIDLRTRLRAARS